LQEASKVLSSGILAGPLRKNLCRCILSVDVTNPNFDFMRCKSKTNASFRLPAEVIFCKNVGFAAKSGIKLILNRQQKGNVHEPE
jgi:hypothetical protein